LYNQSSRGIPFIFLGIVLLVHFSSSFSFSYDPSFADAIQQQQQQVQIQRIDNNISSTNQQQQHQLSLLLPTSKLGVKITSPITGEQVATGVLTIFGISTDNSTTSCQVFVDWNNLKPMQRVMATGPGGENDYSSWTFTYTEKYHLITQGPNELTAKLSCITGPFNSTKYYSVNVQGISSSSIHTNS
jgi:hypothetical protein